MVAPKLRFKEFSEDWGSKKIIELADYVDYRGKTPKKVESGVLLVTAKNIKQGYLDYSASQEFIEESAFDDVMRRGKVELNDVLITTEAPLGNVASVDRTDIALAQRVIKYRGKIGLLDNLFLKQKFLSESFQEILKSKATGGTVQGIKGSVLHQIPLIVPSKEEQMKIASFLSAVDEKISQLTKKHQLLSQYKQGMMQKLFSQQIRFKADDGSEFGEWKSVFLGDISKPQQWKTISSSELTEIGYPVFGANGYIGFYPKYNHINETIAVTCRGATCGEVTLVKAKSYITGNAMSIDEINENEHSTLYIYYALCFRGFKDVISGSAQPQIVGNAIRKVTFQIPCLEEQTKIANFLSAIDQKIEVTEQQIEQAKQWKKGLLQQMFV